MVAVRRLLGVLFLGLVGIPLMAAMIFVTGVLHALLGEPFLSGVPAAVVAEVPSLADDVFEVSVKPGVIKDENSRLWAEAAARTGLKPSQVLERAGLTEWLGKDLVASFDEVGSVLRGQKRPEEAAINLTGLKAALSSKGMREYLASLIGHLPPCADRQADEWARLTSRGVGTAPVPACNPGVTEENLSLVAFHLQDFPDKVPLFENRLDYPERLDVLATVRGLLWLLLLVPVIVILLGASIFSGTLSGTLRASAVAGLFAAFTSVMGMFAVRGAAVVFATVDPTRLARLNASPFWSGDAQQVLARHLARLAGIVVDRVFSPVSDVALFTAIAAIALLGLSFLVARRSAA